jgi:DNA-binding CsgD family transcriptional regulator
MPGRTPEAVVVSPLRLCRELLATLLPQRYGVRVAGYYSCLEECELPASAGILIWDHMGSAEEGNRALARIRASSSRLRIISIDSRVASLDHTIALLRGVIDFPAAVQENLTRPECEVLLGVASGLRSSDIAKRMRRSGKTVEKHRANVFRKLNLRNVAQLTAYAIESRLLKPSAILPGFASPRKAPR